MADACSVPVIGKSCVYISFEAIRKVVYIGLAETSGAGEKTLYFMEDTVGSDYFESMSDWLKSDLPDTSEGWDNIVKDTFYEHNIDGDTSL